MQIKNSFTCLFVHSLYIGYVLCGRLHCSDGDIALNKTDNPFPLESLILILPVMVVEKL